MPPWRLTALVRPAVSSWRKASKERNPEMRQISLQKFLRRRFVFFLTGWVRSFMGAVAGQGIRPPEALHPGAGLAVLAGLVAADGALRFHAGVGMDEDVRLTPIMIVEDFFQLFDLSVAGFQ